MDRLTKLCNKYGTDKGTEAGSSHGFSVFYEPFFNKLENPKILEIGVLGGAFEKAISEYYDGDCTIYCVDVVDSANLFDGMDNVKFFQCDCGAEVEIQKLIDKFGDVEFDVVIDDASHAWIHQLLSLLHFRRLLKDGGVFIMEDLHSSFEDIFRGDSELNETPLDMIAKLSPCNFFTEDENKEILGSISECFLYSRHNKRRLGEGDVFCRSVTAVMKINKNG